MDMATLTLVCSFTTMGDEIVPTAGFPTSTPAIAARHSAPWDCVISAAAG